AFGIVTVPWYAWVGAETRGSYLIEFFLKHNVNRFTNSMEGHAGNPAYYLLVLVVGLAPWSAFLVLALWYSLRFPRESSSSPLRQRGKDSVGLEDSTHPTTQVTERHSIVFLWCWIIVYFAFFSLSKTKLPNYILPIYPAVALLTGRFLEQWRRGDVRPPDWMLHAAPVCLALIGLGLILALPMI